MIRKMPESQAEGVGGFENLFDLVLEPYIFTNRGPGDWGRRPKMGLPPFLEELKAIKQER